MSEPVDPRTPQTERGTESPGASAHSGRSIGKSNVTSKAAGKPAPIKIRNVGPKSQAWLRQVGVRTTEEIRAIGAFETFLKVRKAGFKASLSLIYALAGAEDDVHWQALPAERKAELAARFDAFEIEQKANKKIFRPRGESSGMGASLVERALGPSERDD